MSIVSQHVKPLNVSKSLSSCNVCNQNVHIINSISNHTKPLSVGKSDCFYNVSKPVCKIINNHQVFNPVCESVVVNLNKHAHKQYFNVSSQKHGVTESLNVRNILMTFIYFYELVLLFFIFHQSFCNSNVDNSFKGDVMHNNFSRNKFLNYDTFIYHDVNIFNISYTIVLSSSDCFYPFSFYFCKYSFFIYSIFNEIFYVNNITNIFYNNLYITGLLYRDNKF